MSKERRVKIVLDGCLDCECKVAWSIIFKGRGRMDLGKWIAIGSLKNFSRIFCEFLVLRLGIIGLCENFFLNKI